MKKNLLVLLISLLPMMCAFSQSTYPKLTQDSLVVITPSQLKATNLIFAEHRALKLEVSELNALSESYKLLSKNLTKSNTIKTQQVEQLTFYAKEADQQITLQSKNINKLTKSNNRLKLLSFGGITFGVTSLLMLLMCK